MEKNIKVMIEHDALTDDEIFKMALDSEQVPDDSAAYGFVEGFKKAMSLVVGRTEQLKSFAHFLKWQPEGYTSYSTEEEMVKDFKSL